MIIQYRDDTGFYADGRFVDGVLHHGGYVFRRADEDGAQTSKGSEPDARGG